jgi:autotransporter-associated beta strand protein
MDPVFGYGGLDIGKAIHGPAAFDWGDVTVNLPGGSSTWSNDIGGSGGLVKQGAGTLVLAGDSDFTGATRVNAGVLEASSQLGGAANVAAAGTLRLRGGVDGALTNNGTVQLLGAARNTVIGGNYSQGASARLLFLVGAPLHVRGIALLDGELQVTGIASGYVRQNRETVVQADGSLSGTFSSLSNGPGVFLQATLDYDSNNAWLDITRLDVSATAQAMGFAPTALSAAQRIEGAFDAIDNGTPMDDPRGGFAAGAGALQRSATAAAAERTLSSLSGEVQGADGLFATMAIEGGRRAVEARVDARTDRFPDGGAWADADGFQRQAMGRLAVDGHGWTMGQDLRLANGVTVGAAFGQTDALAWLGGTRDHDRARLTDGQVYAAWESGANYLFGRYAYGRIDRHVQRELLLGDARFASLSDQVSHYSAFELQAGRHFEIAGTRLTPYAGVHAMQLERDAYTEDEAVGFGLQADDSTARATQSALGLRLARDWSLHGVRMALSGRAEWSRTLSQSGTDIDARFNAIDVWSPIPGQPLSSEAAIFGFGLEALFPRLGQWRFGVDQRHEGGRDWMQTRLDWRFGF